MDSRGVQARRGDHIATRTSHQQSINLLGGAPVASHVDVETSSRLRHQGLRQPAVRRCDGCQLGNLGRAVEISDDDPAACGYTYVGVWPFVPPFADLCLVGRGVFLPRLDPRVLAGRLAGAATATDAARRGVAWENSPTTARILQCVIYQQATRPCRSARAMLLTST